MKAKYVSLFLLAVLVFAIGALYLPSLHLYNPATKKLKSFETEGDDDDQRAAFIQQRLQYEYDILKDPVTGKVPSNILQEESKQARSIPVKEYDSQRSLRTAALNTYLPAGPDNIGGRTRAVAFDKRYGTGGNQVIIAGSVSGGIYRSADGGATWKMVTPAAELHNVTALAQDTRSGSENTWYAGGGESLGNSATGSSAFYFGYGILKSTDNGLTWTRLTLNVTDLNGAPLTGTAIETFDNAFDLVHKIIVSPANGYVYICGHRRLIRSTDGGTSFNVVFGSLTVAATSDAGQMDVITNSAGRLFLAVNGGNPDLSIRGVWTSASGNANTWVRFAGGQTAGVDSINGWRANSYAQTNNTYDARRIILALAPSSQGTLYAYYENGLSQKAADGAHPEADLFRFNVSGSNPPFTAANLSANMPDFPGQSNGVDPLTVQGGYDMVVAVKPDNPNVVYVGGTNLYRSTDGFNTTANTEWIGGYKKANPPTAETFTNSHPDMHNLVFDPSNANRAICANDGGLQTTNDISAATVTWAMVSNYQTLQYYYVAINPASGKNDFIGGAQDNGCYVRYNPSNTQTKVSSGDGGAVAIGSLTSTVSRAYVSSTQGTIIRATESTSTNITPSALTANPEGGFGDFITYFKIDFDNPENLYYANYNRIFRTKNASSVTSATWEELTGISNAVNAQSPRGTNISIRALEPSRGPYAATHVLYMGTSNGKVYRLDNPVNAAATATPVDITPTGMTGNVSDIAVNPNRDDEILVTVSNYGATSIWWTNNAKSAAPTWKNAEGNITLPSVRSCMIVVKKDASNKPVTEYYIGTSVGLYSTTDISATTVAWAREGSNVLNYAVVTSLDYRPQDNTLLVGTHGNGMFYATTGTANFIPDVTTGVNDPVLNDVHFIQSAYPALAGNQINYKIGNMYAIQKLMVTVHTMGGQLTEKRQTGYANGTVDVSSYAHGVYVLTITSSDNKQKFVQQFMKN